MQVFVTTCPQVCIKNVHTKKNYLQKTKFVYIVSIEKCYQRPPTAYLLAENHVIY